MVKKILKILTINFITLLILILLLETIFFSLRLILKKQSLGWILPHEAFKNVHDPCLRMITHPILGLTNYHQDNCKIRNGKAIGEFVYYDFKKENKTENILVLGGSSSSGFNTHYANGTTWPELLNLRCQKEKNCRVINGGVSSYNSSHEMLKLSTNVSNFIDKIDIVISLNGINETNFIKDFPFLTAEQIYMFEKERWLIRGITNKYSLLLPNIQSFIRLITKKRQSDIIKFEKNYDISRKLKNLHFPDSNIKSSVDRWEHNIKLMNAISKTTGSKYIIFLQPTTGLNHLKQSEKELESIKDYSKIYLNNVNSFYSEAIERCKKIDFCYDLTDIFSNIRKNNNLYKNKHFYYDGRHYNTDGINILSDEIYRRLY
tara:strand:- start:406 stop:1530 length:1125 start_codon:yes stop_codon:yes gene_type:complete